MPIQPIGLLFSEVPCLLKTFGPGLCIYSDSCIETVERNIFLSMPRMLFVGLLFMVLHSGCWASFHRKIKQHETASNKAFHDSLLQQLANHRNASSPVLGDDVRLVSNTTSESLITGTNSFAAADDTLQVYLSSTLPVNPAPPQSCSNALIAPVNCNSTISLMAYVFPLPL